MNTVDDITFKVKGKHVSAPMSEVKVLPADERHKALVRMKALGSAVAGFARVEGAKVPSSISLMDMSDVEFRKAKAAAYSDPEKRAVFADAETKRYKEGLKSWSDRELALAIHYAEDPQLIRAEQYRRSKK